MRLALLTMLPMVAPASATTWAPDSTCDTLSVMSALISRAAAAGHHSKAAALLTCVGRLHGRVEREDVGLEGDAVDDADDLADAAR